jgi:hypothetical protein
MAARASASCCISTTANPPQRRSMSGSVSSVACTMVPYRDISRSISRGS